MTASRLPPPSDDDIPRPVPGPEAPPPVDIEVDVTADELVEEEFVEPETKVERRCLGCGGDFIELPNDLEPPRTHGEAWGEMGGICRGTRDPNAWSWCRGPIGDGRLLRPAIGTETYFRDRRRTLTPVENERRRPPLPPEGRR